MYFGNADGYLFAVDLLSGQELWKFKTDDWVMSSPVVSNGMVFFGSDDGHLYALK